MYQTLTKLKTMLRSNMTWIPPWRQAREAMQKRRVRPGTKGLAANIDRVLRRIGLGGHGRTEEGERLHITQRPAGHWKRQAAREWKLRQAANRKKAAKDLEKLDIQMSTKLLRVKTLTNIQKGQLRAIQAGAVHTEEELSRDCA